jgi:3-oxoacyl-[acyl-carrier-protein] synthase-3
MIRTGIVKNALVIGVELISQYMDWDNRNVAVLFGDGAAAVVLQATEEESGVIGEKLQCYADARQILRVRGMGTTYANRSVTLGDTLWDFDGQEIFKRAVHGMTSASQDVLAKTGHAAGEIDLVVPHQANLRIIEAVAKRIGAPMERVFLTVQRYGNMSAATVPVALVEALEEGRVKPGALIMTPRSAAASRGARISSAGVSERPPCDDRSRSAAADADGNRARAQPDRAEAAARPFQRRPDGGEARGSVVMCPPPGVPTY